MNEFELREKYEVEKPYYTAWGNYIKQKILNELSHMVNIELFLKTHCEPRVKDTKSLINKAFYRNKKYTDPYNQITDKVGIRFVVLLTDDIKIVEYVINNVSEWTCRKDRDYEEERLNKPEVFTYQSVHYIVTNNQQINEDNISIPQGIACEVQIRTLLQHAYSELTHDTVYKPRTKAEPMVHRLVARSMALIETTDELFGEVNKMLLSKDSIFEEMIANLKDIYSVIAQPDYARNLNMYIFDAYYDIVTGFKMDEIRTYLGENPIIKDIIMKRYDKSLLYRQPIILLLVFLIMKKRKKTLELWPLTISEIVPLYTDLGISIPD